MNGLLVYILISVAAIVPLMKLLPHFGVNKYWALTAFLPVFIVILLWVMSMKLQEREDG